MTQNITGNDVFTEPVVAPSDGEAVTAASVSTPLQALADQAKYLKNKVEGVLDVQVFTSSGRGRSLAGRRSSRRIWSAQAAAAAARTLEAPPAGAVAGGAGGPA